MYRGQGIMDEGIPSYIFFAEALCPKHYLPFCKSHIFL